MTKEKLEELKQLQENIDFITSIIDKVELFGVTVDTPSKTIEVKEWASATKKLTVNFTEDTETYNQLMKILSASQKAKLKSLRQYRAKLQGKFNRL